MLGGIVFAVKLGGFDFATVLDKEVPKTRGMIGTKNYIAPEIIYKQPYDHHVDVWSVSIVAYVLLSGHFPFYGKPVQRLLDQTASSNAINVEDMQ